MAASFRFDGKRILVTGAGKGLGREIATTLHRYGATVVALGRTKADLDSLEAELPGLITVHCDVSNWATTREAVNKVLPIHHLVNNAVIAGPNKPFTEITEQDLNDVFSVNFNAMVNISQVVVKDMIARKEGGSIVNVSSIVSKVRVVNHAPYCCTKSAIKMLTKSMGFELAPRNIRVNAIQPTYFLTQMTRKVLTEDKVFADDLLKRHPTGRFPEISHVVDAILFLLSDLSTMMIGSEVLVDAGYFTN